ncbi:hypothetical protein NB688_003561 [Xanthomonas sacchari]|uniref:Uncharacterized protein n=1 Tax=Xanthomonas sacchari TaxID=56458 RepID=A0ABT3DX85_9XANT|nr:hypothetical protein [Xanthomonas sacchari]MCW0400115.1 hypothetical protein [Xanthomonas sacchari]MCW0421395.1 hypothetical protein [Xanthomonas sacchari]
MQASGPGWRTQCGAAIAAARRRRARSQDRPNQQSRRKQRGHDRERCIVGIGIGGWRVQLGQQPIAVGVDIAGTGARTQRRRCRRRGRSCTDRGQRQQRGQQQHGQASEHASTVGRHFGDDKCCAAQFAASSTVVDANRERRPGRRPIARLGDRAAKKERRRNAPPSVPRAGISANQNDRSPQTPNSLVSTSVFLLALSWCVYLYTVASFRFFSTGNSTPTFQYLSARVGSMVLLRSVLS